MKTVAELESGLAQFGGTEHYYKYIGGLVLTDGVKWLADNTGCYWFIDIIASLQRKCNKDPSLREIQFWTLKVNGEKAVVIVERDTDDVFYTQKISFTDFPLAEMKIYVENGVVMLPSER